MNDPTAVARAKLALGNGLGINRVAKLAGPSNGTVADQDGDGGTSVERTAPHVRMAGGMISKDLDESLTAIAKTFNVNA